jgi:hypothetical protein
VMSPPYDPREKKEEAVGTGHTVTPTTYSGHMCNLRVKIHWSFKTTIWSLF